VGTPSTGGIMDGLTIAASLSEIAPRLVGGTLRSIYQPARMQFLVKVFAKGTNQLILDLGDASIRTSEQTFENPSSPSSFVMLVRKHLRGTRIAAIAQRGLDRVVTMEVERRQGHDRIRYELIVELVGVRGNLHLVRDGVLVRSLREDGRNVPGEAFVPLPEQQKHAPASVTPDLIESWLRTEAPDVALAKHVDGIGRATARDLAATVTGNDPALELFLRLKELLSHIDAPRAHVLADGSRATFYPPPKEAEPAASLQEALDCVAEPVQFTSDGEDGASDVSRELARAIKAKERTIAKLVEWLDTSEQADTWQAQADLLMTFASDIPRGEPSASVSDPMTGREVTIRLDPSRSAVENAQGLYKRAKRIRKGHPHVLARLERSNRDLDLLRSAHSAHNRGEPIPSAVLDLLPRRRRTRKPPSPSVPFRRFEAEGFHIWVGKSARENDDLIRAASPGDLWMHAKGVAGSHVVVRASGRQTIPTSVRQAAARLAARHSKARTERRVEVLVARIRDVRKPKGAPPGLVNVRTADTLTVDLEGNDS